MIKSTGDKKIVSEQNVSRDNFSPKSVEVGFSLDYTGSPLLFRESAESDTCPGHAGRGICHAHYRHHSAAFSRILR